MKPVATEQCQQGGDR